MIDASIISDSDLLEKAKAEKRAKRNAYQKQWRKRFIAEHGIEPAVYYEAKRLKKAQANE